MKAEIKITDITHDDLVNLFSTAGYGSQWLVFFAPASVRKHKKEDDCFEDILAKALLNGLAIDAFDYYDDDSVHYTITLHDIEKGIAKCLSGDKKWDKDTNNYLRNCAMDLIGDECVNLDQPEAEAIMQVIMFGEVIYG